MNPRTKSEECKWIGFAEEYGDDCEMINGAKVCRPRGSVSDISTTVGKITPEIMHQITSLTKIVTETSFSLEQVLALWGNINRTGVKPLYDRMFLTHNMRRMDPIFIPDTNGNVLQDKRELLSKHLTAIQAAFNVREFEDLSRIIGFLKLTSSTWKPRLTLENLSAIYRYWLVVKAFQVKARDLKTLVGIFPRLLDSPQEFLKALGIWKKIKLKGVKLSELDFAINLKGTDDPDNSAAPSLIDMLKMTKALHERLSKIEADHPDIQETIPFPTVTSSKSKGEVENPDRGTDQQTVSSDLAVSKLEEFFSGTSASGEMVVTTMGLLEGSTKYTRKQGFPASLLPLTIPNDLKGRVSIATAGKRKTLGPN